MGCARMSYSKTVGSWNRLARTTSLDFWTLYCTHMACGHVIIESWGKPRGGEKVKRLLFIY
jgi:hypothetical protein